MWPVCITSEDMEVASSNNQSHKRISTYMYWLSNRKTTAQSVLSLHGQCTFSDQKTCIRGSNCNILRVIPR